MGISRGVLPWAQTSGRRRILLRCGAAPLKKRRSSLLRHPRTWLGRPLGLILFWLSPFFLPRPSLSAGVVWLDWFTPSLCRWLDVWRVTSQPNCCPLAPCFGSLVDHPPRALSESSSGSEGPKTGCLERLVPGSLRGGFDWQPALACGWPPFAQVTGLLAAFLAAGVDWRLSWFRMILDPQKIRMIICSWSSLEPGADLGVGSWSYVCLLCRCASFCGGARRAFLSAGTGAWCLCAWSLARVRGGPCASTYAGSRPKVSCDNC